jgi:outer membrane protein, heavy metal efflux system
VRFILFLLPLLLLGCAEVTAIRPDPLPVEPGAPSPLCGSPREGSPVLGREGRTLPEEAAPRVIDLAGVLEAIEKSPALQAEREKVARETGLVLQGSYMPNPVLTLETEMMPLDDMGFGNARNKIRVTQRVETAGKADARVAFAAAKRDEAEAAYFHRRQDMTALATKLFYGILYYGEMAKSQRCVAELSGEIEKLATELNRGGRISDRDLIAFQVGRGLAAVKVFDYEAEEKKKTGELEGLLGLAAGSIDSCRGAPPSWSPGEAGDATAAILGSSCELVLLDRKVLVSRADLDLKESGAWEDVTFGLTYARGDEMGTGREDFIGASVQIPLPLVDRNQGAIQGARAAVRGAERDIEAAALRLLDEWHGLRRQWLVLRENRNLRENSVLPALEKALLLATSSVSEGRAAEQEKLDAALDLERERLEVLRLTLSLAEIRADMIFITGDRQL